MIRCDSCNVSFTSNKGWHQHMKGKRHTERINGILPVLDHACSCGKTYSHRQSLHVHKMSCSSPSVTEIIEDLKNTVLEERKIHQLEREQYQKEHNELEAKISLILDKHMQPAQNTTTSMNCNNNNTTNIENQHINININSFGNENTDYIDNKAILACIRSVYKSFLLYWRKFILTQNIQRIIISKSPTKNYLMLL